MEINHIDPESYGSQEIETNGVDPREKQFIDLLEKTGEELKSMNNISAGPDTPMVERLRLQQAQINQQDYIIRKLYNIIRLDYDLRV